ncbi:MAG: hypothetical protein AABX05_02500 [Nanoarchaeota archaeon]
MSLDELTIEYQELDPRKNSIDYLEVLIEVLCERGFYGYNTFYNFNYAELTEFKKNSKIALRHIKPEKKKRYVGLKNRLDLLTRIKRHEEEIQEPSDYTLKDFIKKPFRPTWNEMMKDSEFRDLFKGSTFSRTMKEIGSTLAAFGVIAVPHELIHAGVNSLTGGTNKEIVFNTLYGGQIWEQLIPGVQSKIMFPLLGGYVKPENNSSLAMFAVGIAPYIMTPAGIYLAQKGRENRNIILSAAGAGIVATHAGGIVGDWMGAGSRIVKGGIELVEDMVGEELKVPDEYATYASIPIMLAGLYIGSKIMGVSYRGMKATVNSVRSYSKKK